MTRVFEDRFASLLVVRRISNKQNAVFRPWSVRSMRLTGKREFAAAAQTTGDGPKRTLCYTPRRLGAGFESEL